MSFLSACRYRNYPPEFLVDLIARVLALVPPWVRVYRIQRDIPMPLVSSGVEKGNLRELALQRMEELRLRCRDVRSREAGIQVGSTLWGRHTYSRMDTGSGVHDTLLITQCCYRPLVPHV